MTCIAFWHMNGEVSVKTLDTYSDADMFAFNLVAGRMANPVYMVDMEDHEWLVYRKAPRHLQCRREDVPVDEVPKPYQLIAMLGG